MRPIVYFVTDGQGHCKIGVTSDIKKRLNTLQVGSAFPLSVKHTIDAESLDEAYDIEKAYHSALSEKRIRGEWFDENAVDALLNGESDDGKKKYLCDVAPEFEFKDVAALYLMMLECKSKDEFLERYEKEVPTYIKKWDKERYEKKDKGIE